MRKTDAGESRKVWKGKTKRRRGVAGGYGRESIVGEGAEMEVRG